MWRISFWLASTLSLAAQDIRLTPVGTYRGGAYNSGAAEIVAHDPRSQRLFVVNGGLGTVDVVDIRDPAAPVRINRVEIPQQWGRSANSVAVANGTVAVAVEAMVKTDPGAVIFMDADGRLLSGVRVGALPDMITFTPNGRYVLTADEGEPSDDYRIDPEGSVSIIDVGKGAANVTQSDVRTADFRAFTRASLDSRVRIFGPNNPTVAQDLEPEYIAVAPDSRTAYVTLQENNAIAMVDIETARVSRIAPLDLKEHWRRGNEFDPSDRDGARLNVWTVWGMYQPDGITGFTGADGKFYLITANEGDAREWGSFVEAQRLSTLRLDPVRYPNAAELQLPENLGRLNVSSMAGDEDGDGDIDVIHSFGARSITVWTDAIEPVWDSHNQLEVFCAAERPEAFNTGHTDNTVDSRSDDKGPEPESVVTGMVRGRRYAFVGNERTSSIAVYDLADPQAPRYIRQFWNRDFNAPTSTPEAGDLGPEGLAFISAEDSPTGQPFLAVANEISGTVTLWRID
jgi:hypothetical protein